MDVTSASKQSRLRTGKRAPLRLVCDAAALAPERVGDSRVDANGTDAVDEAANDAAAA